MYRRTCGNPDPDCGCVDECAFTMNTYEKKMTQEQKWLSYVAELREKHDKELCGWIDECKSARADISKLVEDRNNLIDEINSIRAEKSQLSKEFKDADMRCGKVGALYEEYKALYEKTLGRVNGLEEWITEYRDQLKKENVYHKNTGIINAINELLDETSTDI